MSLKEIATTLDLSLANVKIRLHRSKEMLKEILYKLSNTKDLFEFGFKQCDRLTEKVMGKIQQSPCNDKILYYLIIYPNLLKIHAFLITKGANLLFSRILHKNKTGQTLILRTCPVLYSGRDLNPHEHYCSLDFKSSVSTNSTTRA